MKTRNYLILFAVLTGLIVSSCGYRNPYVYSGPDKNLYITNWPNRTNDLLLDAKIYQKLVSWFQKSGSIKVVGEKKGAHLILGGEIMSIDLPSLSYGSGNDATEVRVLLTVRYVLKDIENNKVLLEVGRETWTQEYKVGASSSENSDNEKEALDIIIDDLSEKIYINTLNKLSQ